MAKKETLTPLMKFYFETWKACSFATENASDEHKFNLFVRSCVQHRSGAWLLELLRMHGVPDRRAVELVSKFDTIKGYLHSVTFYAGKTNVPTQFLWQPKKSKRKQVD